MTTTLEHMTTTLEKAPDRLQGPPDGLEPDGLEKAPADQLALELPLTEKEIGQLRRAEMVIQDGLETFRRVGTALAGIRESRLYRQSYASFEDYCERKWSMGRSSAYRLMGAVDVLRTIEASPIGEGMGVPQNEAQARPLTALAPGEQPVAWARANEIAQGEGAPVTAAIVQRAVDEMRPPAPPPAAEPSAEERTLFGADEVPTAPVAHAEPGPVPASEVIEFQVMSRGEIAPITDVAALTPDGDAHTSPPTPALKTEAPKSDALKTEAPKSDAPKPSAPAPLPVAVAKPTPATAPAPVAPALPPGFTTALVKVEDFAKAQEMGLWPPAAGISYVEELEGRVRDLEGKLSSTSDLVTSDLVTSDLVTSDLVTAQLDAARPPSPALALAVAAAGQLADAARTGGGQVLTSDETEILDEMFWDRPETLPEHMMAVILTKRLRTVDSLAAKGVTQ